MQVLYKLCLTVNIFLYLLKEECKHSSGADRERTSTSIPYNTVVITKNILERGKLTNHFIHPKQNKKPILLKS